MTEHRWSKFWWQDYAADDALRVVSLGAQGLWMRMLCAMHNGTPYGHLTINGKAPTPRQIAAIASAPEREVLKYLAELEAGAVFSRTDDGTIYNRRMVRDKAISEKGREDGKRGGNPTLIATPNREGLTPTDNGGGYTLEAEADTEAESVPPVRPPPTAAPRSASPTPAGRGCRIPDDWTPADHGFAAEHGVDGPQALAEFRDYWRGVAGKAGVKLDWEATWRNQIRHLAKQRGGRPALKTSQMPVPDQNAELLRMMARHRTDDTETPYPVLRIAQ